MACNVSPVEVALNPALELVVWCLTHSELGLAAKKMEVVILIRKWAYKSPVVLIGGNRVSFGRTIRYLGVHLHSWRHFGSHVRKVAARASVVSAAASCLLTKYISRSISGEAQIARHSGLRQVAVHGRGMDVHRHVGDKE